MEYQIRAAALYRDGSNRAHLKRLPEAGAKPPNLAQTSMEEQQSAEQSTQEYSYH